MATVVRKPVEINGIFTLTVSTTEGAVGRALSEISKQGYPFTGDFSILGSSGINLIDMGVEGQGEDAAIQAVSRELRVLKEKYKVLSFGLSVKADGLSEDSLPDPDKTETMESKLVDVVDSDEDDRREASEDAVVLSDDGNDGNSNDEDDDLPRPIEKGKTFFGFGGGSGSLDK